MQAPVSAAEQMQRRLVVFGFAGAPLRSGSTQQAEPLELSVQDLCRPAAGPDAQVLSEEPALWSERVVSHSPGLRPALGRDRPQPYAFALAPEHWTPRRFASARQFALKRPP